MKVLFVASECAPFVKTGGLADVVGAVPKALQPMGVDVRILLPAYPALMPLLETGETLAILDDLFGGSGRLVAVHSAGLDLILLDAPHLFDREGSIYLDHNGKDWDDNHLRFGGLCVAAAKVATGLLSQWQPDLVHGHDWQAGLVPLLIKLAQPQGAPPCVMTVHNIAFQGLFHWSTRALFSIPDAHFTHEGAEYYGHLGFLKAGLAYCDEITTVSPTYARELLTPEFGMGLEGLLQARQQDLSGILNGIDLVAWDPQTDPALPTHYSRHNRRNKALCRTALAQRFALNEDVDAPLFCVISRLTEQKGLDLLLQVLPDLVARGAQLALLGSGDAGLEQGFSAAAQQFPGRVGTFIGYDEDLSHLVQAGSDAIIIPSRFEPCGLTQLYGLRYGTLPVVARTGGLADTVIDATPEAIKQGQATGVQFSPVDASGLDEALSRTCALFERKRVWRGMMGNAMRYPVGWEESAPAYHALYQRLLTR